MKNLRISNGSRILEGCIDAKVECLEFLSSELQLTYSCSGSIPVSVRRFSDEKEDPG